VRRFQPAEGLHRATRWRLAGGRAYRPSSFGIGAMPGHQDMVLAMFAGNEEGGHYTDEEIRELVNLIWEWQWGVSRALLDAFNVQGGAQAAE
jgi:hypothetical protein